MATKLKNLEVSKVDFVDAGANPDAHIKLYKRKDANGGAGEAKGEGNESTGLWKRLIAFVGKAAGMGQDEIDNAVEEIQKGDSVGFKEKFNEAKNRKIADEIWDICYALQSSLYSILNDDDLDTTGIETAMQESVDEFCNVAQECIKQWSKGKSSSVMQKEEEVTKADLEIMKSARDRLTAAIEKASVGTETNNDGRGEQEMKIDKSKLTPAEAAFLDSIEKRYGTEEVAPTSTETGGIEKADSKGKGNKGKEEEEEVKDGKPAVKKSATGIPEIPGAEDDIYKGLHPAVKAELESLKKFRENAEDRELHEVAKRYAIIGKKEEELVPLFKSLRAAGGTAYDDMIAVMDQAVDTVEKSGAFSEIGKSGHVTGSNSAEAKVDTIAKGYIEKDPSLSYTDAIAKAWENNPELMEQYEEEAGF